MLEMLRQLLHRAGGQGLLARLGTASTLALGATAAAGLLIVAHISNQGWPVVNWGGAGPSAVLDLGSSRQQASSTVVNLATGSPSNGGVASDGGVEVGLGEPPAGGGSGPGPDRLVAAVDGGASEGPGGSLGGVQAPGGGPRPAPNDGDDDGDAGPESPPPTPPQGPGSVPPTAPVDPGGNPAVDDGDGLGAGGEGTRGGNGPGNPSIDGDDGGNDDGDDGDDPPPAPPILPDDGDEGDEGDVGDDGDGSDGGDASSGGSDED